MTGKSSLLPQISPVTSFQPGDCTHYGLLAGGKKTQSRAPALGKRIYNIVRPYQALGYLTRLQFLRQISS